MDHDDSETLIRFIDTATRDYRGMNQLTPQEKEAAMNRMATIEQEMFAIQRRAAINGENLVAEWDKLNIERAGLEQKLSAH